MFDAIATLVEDPKKFTHGRIGRNRIIPNPDDCAACGDLKGYHGMSWVTRKDGTGEFHSYEAPSNELRLLRMKARLVVGGMAGRKGVDGYQGV